MNHLKYLIKNIFEKFHGYQIIIKSGKINLKNRFSFKSVKGVIIGESITSINKKKSEEVQNQ